MSMSHFWHARQQSDAKSLCGSKPFASCLARRKAGEEDFPVRGPRPYLWPVTIVQALQTICEWTAALLSRFADRGRSRATPIPPLPPRNDDQVECWRGVAGRVTWRLTATGPLIDEGRRNDDDHSYLFATQAASGQHCMTPAAN